MDCIVPNLAADLNADEKKKLFQLDEDSRRFYVGFKLDGVTDLKNLSTVPYLKKYSRLSIFKDPLYHTFKKDERTQVFMKVFDPAKHELLTLLVCIPVHWSS